MGLTERIATAEDCLRRLQDPNYRYASRDCVDDDLSIVDKTLHILKDLVATNGLIPETKDAQTIIKERTTNDQTCLH